MVHRIYLFLRRLDRSTILEAWLLACWFAGSSLGLWAARYFGDAYASFLGSLPGVSPGFGGILASAFLPLLFSACAVVVFHTAGCFGVCLLRGLTQGFLLGLMGGCFGAAAPVMAVLLGFTSLMVSMVLLLFCLRRLRLGAFGFQRDLAVCFGLCGLIGLTDHLAIAPFLAEVINL